MVREFASTRVVNERERPRVLIWVTDREAFKWVESRAGTFQYINHISEVDTDEWDVIVTHFNMTEYRRGSYGRQYGTLNPYFHVRIIPSNLYVFRVLDPSVLPSNEVLLDYEQLEGKRLPFSDIEWERDVPGHRLRRAENLPDSIQSLVKSSLIPAIDERKFQHGVRIKQRLLSLAPAFTKFRPFLFGPQDLVLACSYARLDDARVWLVPSDVTDLGAWFDIALAEWHAIKPEAFPADGVWQTSTRWVTNSEREVSQAITALEDEFATARVRYENDRDRLVRTLESHRLAANIGRRTLLTGQGDELQEAARTALVDIGFDVEDMDLKWAEQERREDFRIRDSDDPLWLVIADSIGVASGANGSKIQTIGAYVTRFVLEDLPATAPGQWLLVNRLLDRDPNTRGDIFRDDDLMVFSDQRGLTFDTPALFVLAEACNGDPLLAKSLRAWLREMTGQLTLEVARDWLGSVKWSHQAQAIA